MEELDYAEQFERDWIDECNTPPEPKEECEYEMSDEEFQTWMDEMNASAKKSWEFDEECKIIEGLN